MLAWLIGAAGLGLAIANLLSLIPSDIWWIRITDFPRLQSAAALALLALAAFAWREQLMCSLLSEGRVRNVLSCTGSQEFSIVPVRPA